MEQSFFIVLSLALMIIGIIGTFLPVLPGLLLAYAGFLLFEFGTDNEMPVLYVWIFGFLSLLSVILSYVIPAKTNRKYGGTRWGSAGAFVGTLLGLFFIPVPFGFLIGMLLGVLAGELVHDSKDMNKALKSAKGAFVGFLYGTGFNFMVGMAMFLVVLYYLIF